MGQSSTISDTTGVGLLVGFFIFLGIVYYHNKASKQPKEEKNENRLTKKKIEERTTPSGDLEILVVSLIS